jgi:hypothetical protein
MCAKVTFFNNMLLMPGGVGIAKLYVNVILRFFPVKIPHPRIGTRRYTHSAAYALIVVLLNNTGVGIFIRCANRADPYTSRIFAVLASDGQITHTQIWESS